MTNREMLEGMALGEIISVSKKSLDQLLAMHSALTTERDALKAELARVRDLAEGDRAAFSDTLCTYRTALRETREALIEMLNNGGCSTVEWMPLATIKTARSVVAKHAALAEGGERG